MQKNSDTFWTLPTQSTITRNPGQRAYKKQRSYCSCSLRDQKVSVEYSVRSLEFYKTVLQSCRHDPICPLFIWSRKFTKAGIKWTYYSALISKTIQANISFSIGAGGCSISPFLRFRSTVSAVSRPFSLLFYVMFGKSRHYRSVLQQLYGMFKDGVVSPADTNEYGETLLLVRMSACANTDCTLTHINRLPAALVEG